MQRGGRDDWAAVGGIIFVGGHPIRITLKGNYDGTQSSGHLCCGLRVGKGQMGIFRD